MGEFLEGFDGSVKDLAFAIGNTSYDITAEIYGGCYSLLKKRESLDWLNPIKRSFEISHKKMKAIWEEICEEKMSSCSKHPSIVVGYNGENSQLSEEISLLGKKDLLSLVNEFSLDLFRQGNGDFAGDRKRLSSWLYSTAFEFKKGYLLSAVVKS